MSCGGSGRCGTIQSSHRPLSEEPRRSPAASRIPFLRMDRGVCRAIPAAASAALLRHHGVHVKRLEVHRARLHPIESVPGWARRPIHSHPSPAPSPSPGRSAPPPSQTSSLVTLPRLCELHAPPVQRPVREVGMAINQAAGRSTGEMNCFSYPHHLLRPPDASMRRNASHPSCAKPAEVRVVEPRDQAFGRFSTCGNRPQRPDRVAPTTLTSAGFLRARRVAGVRRGSRPTPSGGRTAS